MTQHENTQQADEGRDSNADPGSRPWKRNDLECLHRQSEKVERWERQGKQETWKIDLQSSVRIMQAEKVTDGGKGIIKYRRKLPWAKEGLETTFGVQGSSNEDRHSPRYITAKTMSSADTLLLHLWEISRNSKPNL